ncbi:MAG TPA: S1 RNA-binding domain-containing protein [Polyangiaceae bacterium]|nr:S1 RNA-binding domain-containing protein [Polyangiaceae bacterium]
MSSKESFAALMGGAAKDRNSKRLKPGQVVSGTVIQIGNDTVFIDIGAQADAHMARSEFVDRSGKLQVAIGDAVTATVISDSTEHGARLAKSFGRSGSVDTGQLQQAKQSGLPVEGKVEKVTKGGLEVQIGPVRAFCPASQVDLGFVQDLEPFVGQTLQFRVIEIKEEGRSVVVSRKALLQAQTEQDRIAALAKLAVGEVVEGSVVSVQKFGAFVDVGGIQGLVHISELAHHRVDRVEDIVSVGERVQVLIQKLDRTEKGQPRIELSMKALSKPEAQPAPTKRDEVVDATVVKSLPNGIVVQTAQGEGLVPTRELSLPRGADHRRAYPIGSTLRVVVLGRDSHGRLSFSAAKVGAAEERQNFADYGKVDTVAASSKLGSFGDLFRAKLGLPEPPPEAPPPAAPQVTSKPAPVAPVVAPTQAPAQPRVAPPAATPVTAAAPVTAASGPIPASRTYVDATPGPKKLPQRAPGELPVGVVRRKRDAE